MTDANTIEVAKKETMVAANVFGELQAQWEGVAPIHTGLFPVSIGRSADALVELATVTQELSPTLAALLEKTHSYFLTVSEGFAQTDATAARSIKTGG